MRAHAFRATAALLARRHPSGQVRTLTSKAPPLAATRGAPSLEEPPALCNSSTTGTKDYVHFLQQEYHLLATEVELARPLLQAWVEDQGIDSCPFLALLDEIASIERGWGLQTEEDTPELREPWAVLTKTLTGKAFGAWKAKRIRLWTALLHNWHARMAGEVRECQQAQQLSCQTGEDLLFFYNLQENMLMPELVDLGLLCLYDQGQSLPVIRQNLVKVPSESLLLLMNRGQSPKNAVASYLESLESKEERRLESARLAIWDLF